MSRNHSVDSKYVRKSDYCHRHVHICQRSRSIFFLLGKRPPTTIDYILPSKLHKNEEKHYKIVNNIESK